MKIKDEKTGKTHFIKMMSATEPVHDGYGLYLTACGQFVKKHVDTPDSAAITCEVCDRISKKKIPEEYRHAVKYEEYPL